MTEQIPTIYGVYAWRKVGSYWRLVMPDPLYSMPLATWFPQTGRLYVADIGANNRNMNEIGLCSEDAVTAKVIEICVKFGIFDPIAYLMLAPGSRQ